MYSQLRRLVFTKHILAADARYRQSQKGRHTIARYTKSKEGRAAQARYRKSEKGKTYREHYRKSENGRAARRRYSKSEKGQATRALWKAHNWAQILAYCAKRRAQKRKAAIENLKDTAKIYKRAQELRQWFDVVVDHIIPLAKGGAHSSENLQIIYASENLRKNARLDYTPKVVFA